MFEEVRLAERASCPYYTRPCFNPTQLRELVDWAAPILEAERIDAMVACGHSGLILAGALSFWTGLPVFAVRKESETPRNAHSGRVSGIAPAGAVARWAWVDDHLNTGKTLWNAQRKVEEAGLVQSILPACLLLYDNDRWQSTCEFVAVTNQPERMTCNWPPLETISVPQYGRER